jgi:hypothetical protein
MDIPQLQRRQIAWQKTDESQYVFITDIDGEQVRLRLNDFPEEPLCTLIWGGGQVDLNEFSATWTLPKHRGE